LEKQSYLNRELDEHGNIRVQVTNRSVSVTGCDKPQKRWFICVSSPSKPERDSTNKASFGAVIQAAWDQYHPVDVKQEDALETRTSMEQSTPRPRQGVTPTPIATKTINPTADSPSVIKDDSDLLEFFTSILSTEYIRKTDLFVPDLSTIGLQKKLKAFGMKLAANDHEKTYASFHDAPQVYLKKDITTLDPDPCLNQRFGIPMSVPTMSEVAQAIVNLAEDLPEILQLQKHGGSKGAGKRIITMVPSSNKNRLYYNAKKWMSDVVDNATIDASDVDTYDTVHTLV